MKVKKYLLGFVCVLMVVLCTGCFKKKAITTENFKSIVEEKGYATVDVTEQYASYGNVSEATVAESPDGFKIEFYVLEDGNAADGMYKINKSNFVEYEEGASTHSDVNMINYSSYSLTNDETYLYLCQVDNTFLYVRVNSMYKSSAKSIIKDLGY